MQKILKKIDFQKPFETLNTEHYFSFTPFIYWFKKILDGSILKTTRFSENF